MMGKSESAHQSLSHFALPDREVVLENLSTGFFHQPEIEGQIVDAADLHSQQLTGLVEVVEIGTRILCVDEAMAVGVNG